MFQRPKPTIAAQPAIAVPAPAWLDKALPAIPFAPDWAPQSGTPEIRRDLVGETEVKSERAEGELLSVIFTEADPASRDMICGLGRKWGYDVIATTGGNEAIEALSRVTKATIAVISRNMGDMDGLEFCRVTRRSKKPLYIILVTERSDMGQLAEAIAAGADDYLITPFDADELRARLRVGARIIGLQTKLVACACASNLEGTPAPTSGFSAPATDASATPLFGSEDQ